MGADSEIKVHPADMETEAEGRFMHTPCLLQLSSQGMYSLAIPSLADFSMALAQDNNQGERGKSMDMVAFSPLSQLVPCFSVSCHCGKIARV